MILEHKNAKIGDIFHEGGDLDLWEATSNAERIEDGLYFGYFGWRFFAKSLDTEIVQEFYVRDGYEHYAPLYYA